MTTTARKPIVRHSSEVRRELLLQAARTCLSKKGRQGFTLQNIAKEAKVSIGLVGHYFDGIDDLLQEVFKSVMFDLPQLGGEEPGDLATAIMRLHEMVERNFAQDYYSRENLLVWLPIYEEMMLNGELRRKLGALDQRYVLQVAEFISAVARFRQCDVDAEDLAYRFLAYLDGLWLRWCHSERNGTAREREAALRFLESELGPLR